MKHATHTGTPCLPNATLLPHAASLRLCQPAVHHAFRLRLLPRHPSARLLVGGAAGALGSALLEAVLEAAGDVLEGPGAAGAGRLSPLGLLAPVVCASVLVSVALALFASRRRGRCEGRWWVGGRTFPDAGARVSAVGAGLLLDVEGAVTWRDAVSTPPPRLIPVSVVRAYRSVCTERASCCGACRSSTFPSLFNPSAGLAPSHHGPYAECAYSSWRWLWRVSMGRRGRWSLGVVKRSRASQCRRLTLRGRCRLSKNFAEVPEPSDALVPSLGITLPSPSGSKNATSGFCSTGTRKQNSRHWEEVLTK
jgi:hypothetical protein